MRPEVLRQTLLLQRRSLAIWSTTVVLLVALYASLWPSIRDQPSVTELMDRMPEALRSLLAAADMSTPVGYVQTELLGLTGPLLVILFAVVMGASGIAGEEDRRRLDLLLANPVSRTRVLVEKMAAMAVSTVVLVAAMGLALVAGGVLVGLDLRVGNVAAAMLHLSLNGISVGGVAVAVATVVVLTASAVFAFRRRDVVG